MTVLPEFGLDPGLDLVMAGDAVSKLDDVREFYSFGAGIPVPAACTNPLNYKISWNFEAALNSYYRQAKIVKKSNIVVIPSHEIFNRKWL